MVCAPEIFCPPIHQDFKTFQENRGGFIFAALDSMKEIWGSDEVSGQAKAVFARGLVIGMLFSAATEDPIFQEICNSMLERYGRSKGENVADFMLARIKKGT